jgi:hypothetical protein
MNELTKALQALRKQGIPVGPGIALGKGSYVPIAFDIGGFMLTDRQILLLLEKKCPTWAGVQAFAAATSR